jgi:hypothetical protein
MNQNENNIDTMRALFTKLASGRQEYDFQPAALVSHAGDYAAQPHRIHRLMHLWRAADVLKVDEYLDKHSLRRHELFRRLLQSLIELSPARSDERSLLESLSNHVGAKGAKWEAPQAPLPLSAEE